DEVLRPEFLGDPRDRVVVHDDHSALGHLDEPADAVLVEEFLDHVPEALEHIDPFDDRDRRALRPGLDAALLAHPTDGVFTVPAELFDRITSAGRQHSLSLSDPELLRDLPREGRIVHDAHLESVRDAGMARAVPPHLPRDRRHRQLYNMSDI